MIPKYDHVSSIAGYSFVVYISYHVLYYNRIIVLLIIELTIYIINKI